MTDSGQPGPGRPAWVPTGAGAPTPPEPTSPPAPTAPVPVAPATGAPTGPGLPEPAAATEALPVPPTEGETPPGQPPAVPPVPGDEDGDKGRPAWLLPVAIGVAVLLVGGIVAGVVVANRGGGEPAAPPVAVTTILPVPTPDVTPVERTATTPFAQALPDAVLQYALASSDNAPEWVDAGALEAYQETYTDGAGAEVTMLVGQWASHDEAVAFYRTLAKELPGAGASGASADDEGEGNKADGDVASPDPTRTQSGDVTAQDGTGLDRLPQTGPVRVGDTRVGTYSAVDAGDGTGVVVWVNDTAVFRAVVPVDDVLDFYRAFPV